ncbi:MAG: GNAT family N-acetyltransferase [Clostridia bacterium]|nr:GNAT family N-acetyltransferase [Clostridia bacterium]
MNLQTHRLWIRILHAEDWRSLSRIAEDFSNSPYAVYDMPLPVEESEIKPLCERFASSGLWFAVLLSGKMIGYICFHEDNGSYDLGYCFHSAYQGNGYAYESCRAMLAHLANRRNATVFTAGTALNNLPSCKLLYKLGFVLTATEILSFHKDETGGAISFEGGIFRKEWITKTLDS